MIVGESGGNLTLGGGSHAGVGLVPAGLNVFPRLSPAMLQVKSLISIGLRVLGMLR